MTNTHMLAAIEASPDEDMPRLAYADWLDEYGDKADHDRAELIRIQHAIHTGNTYRADALQRRERELIADHPEWTQWECQSCLGTGVPDYPQGSWNTSEECESCSGWGYLLKKRRITWDRGWPGWVHVERMSELVNLNQWGHEQHYREPTPTPLLTALAQTPPWGVPLRGVIVEELEPHIWHGPTSWGWLLSSVHSGPSTIPDAVFYHIQGGNTQDTKQVAIRAAAAAFLEFGRRYNKAAQRDGTGEAEEFLTYP